MRKLIVFNHITLDGYFVDANGGFSWAQHGNDDPEYSAFVAENASGGGELLFGRVTYNLMVCYWPTPIAERHNPVVAKGMNSMPKVVFSRTLDHASWSNTRLVKDDLVPAIRRMKEEPGPGMVILGSGSIVAQIAPEGLIDEYQMMVDPVALGKGRSIFDGIPQRLCLKLMKTRIFNNGKVYLCYEPAA
ncbi:MAG TPA: dihydrofolate reductase family protein [Alloacidobacterium sp.]|nr:dihydrofolate reductase family protein [Alloacidobacterium sp.]